MTVVDAIDRIARKRLAVLQLAERLGNAAEACRRSGIDRTSFYKWKRRYARDGATGLRNRPPVHNSHPQTTPADIARRIVALALAHPAHGCDRIAKDLARRDIEVSPITVQKILHKAGLGTQETRGAALEVRYGAGNKKLTPEQADFLEKLNPCFRARGTECSRPGEVACVGTFFLGRFEGLGPIYVHAVVDGFSSYAFGVIATTTRIEPTLSAVRDQALPFFARKQITVASVLTARISEPSRLMFSQYLSGEGIRHWVSDTDGANGFLERFRRVATVEFLRSLFERRNARAGIARLQRAFDDWLVVYNQQRPHEGYRNYGATPSKVIENALRARSQ
jgi:transposase InsO family protein